MLKHKRCVYTGSLYTLQVGPQNRTNMEQIKHLFGDYWKIHIIIITGVIQLIPPVLSSETLLHILLSSEYSGFRPSTTAVVIIGAPISVPTGPTDRR